MIDQSCPPIPYWQDSARDAYDPAPLAATSLEPIESSGLGDESLAECFRHSGWRKQRKRIYEALVATFQSVSRIQAFSSCGHTCYILQSKTDPDTFRIAASGCHDRFCLPCAQSRSRTIAANVLQHTKNKICRFVTLTLRHSSEPLAVELDRLYDSFKKLRKSPLWKKTQKGGVAFLEIKRSRDGRSWHPHLHVLTEGKYLNHAKLSLQWKAITKDSWIVDVRPAPEGNRVIDYITKYASKPFDPSIFENTAILHEAIKALSGRRMALSFGKWKGLQMTSTPREDEWEFLDTLDGLCFRAAQGDLAAEKILKAALGEVAEEYIQKASRKVVARMNIPPPRTPDPVLYLQ